jgi:hypothetical protein
MRSGVNIVNHEPQHQIDADSKTIPSVTISGDPDGPVIATAIGCSVVLNLRCGNEFYSYFLPDGQGVMLPPVPAPPEAEKL